MAGQRVDELGDREGVVAQSSIARSDRPRVSIVVADDEALVREVTVRMLELLGFRVVAAGDSGECLRFVQQNDDGVDLLVTDVMMPGLDGHELHERMVALRPGLPVLYMSGVPETAGRDVVLLPKPFTLEDLSDAVGRALRGV